LAIEYTINLLNIFLQIEQKAMYFYPHQLEKLFLTVLLIKVFLRLNLRLMHYWSKFFKIYTLWCVHSRSSLQRVADLRLWKS